MGSLIVWWLVLLAMGLLALPLTFLTFKHLPDKGYAFSKVLALLFVGYVGWIFGHVSFNQTVPFLALFLLSVTGLLLWARAGGALIEFFKKKAGYILVVELLFLAAFLLAGAFRMRVPDITGTEKPMDFAMINGILSSHRMPPSDPWLSGGTISYYYFGYFIVASLIKLTGTLPSEGFNLAVALIWALSAVTAFGLGYALTRSYRYAGFSCAAVSVLGNLDFWHRAIQSFRIGDLKAPYYNMAADPAIAKGMNGFFGFLFNPLARFWDYFQASRIVPVNATDKLINEFPSFSFFLADLHPHVMAIPFVLMAVAFCFNLLKAPLPGLEVFGGRRPWQIAQWVLLAVMFGSLGFFNSWDYPTLMLLLGGCLLLQQAWTASKDGPNWLRQTALVGLPVVAATFLLFLPFYLRFQSQAKGLGLVKTRTDLYYLFVIFGIFLIFVIPVVTSRAAAALAGRNAKIKSKKNDGLECVLCGREGEGKKFCGVCGGELAPPTDMETVALPFEKFRAGLQSAAGWISSADNPSRGLMASLGVAALLLVLTLGGLNLSVLVGGLLLFFLALVGLTGKMDNKEMVFATLLTALAALLMAGCEVLYIKDHFDDSALERMNTVFKFHYQVWLLLSVAAAPFLKWIFENQLRAWPSWKRLTWATLATVAIVGSALYPALTLRARLKGTGAQITLDGLAGFKMSNPGDSLAADWILKNAKVPGARPPVVLESWGGSYSSFARIATETGYPTILGWDFHEAQWRGSWDKPAIRGGAPDDTVMTRRQDVDRIYSTPNLDEARELLRKYQVDYVVVGMLERNGAGNKQPYPPEGLDKFNQLGAPLFSQAGTSIYKVNP